MMKRLLVLIACLGLTAHLSGCTSHDAKQDSEVTSDYDSSELEKVEGSEISADGAVTDSTLPDTASSDTSLDAGTDLGTDDTAMIDSTDSSVAPATPPDVTPDAIASTETPVTDSTASTATDIAPPAPSADSSTTVVDSGIPAETSAAAEAPKPASVPLQKMAATPWKVGKNWANAIYFARPGDSLESISQMIYGADKTDMLKKMNPTFNSRDVKAGDKVYYNSPQRADDSTKVATYYEDNGQQAEVYTAKAGDNIRAVSKEILGYPNAWKEIWASNDVDSKGELAEGTQLKYWRGGAATVAAQNPPVHEEMTPPAASPEVAMPPQEVPAAQAQNNLPPPPSMNELPPPPPPPADMAMNEAALPPPPPPQEMAPPPPPPPPPAPPVAEKHPHHDSIDASAAPMGMDSDTTMALAAVGLAAAGLAVLIVVRKKRKQKEMDHVMNDTQVGT